MWSFGIVPQKVFHKADIEAGGVQKFWLMVVNVLLLDGAVEPFGVRIHLGRLWIGMPVGQMEVAEFLIKVFHEFTTIIGQHVLETKGKQEAGQIKEFLGG